MLCEIGLLPVYNKLYKLGLDEEQIEKITTKHEELKNTQYTYHFIANDTLINVAPTGGRNAQVELISGIKEKVDNKKTVNCSYHTFDHVILSELPFYTTDRDSWFAFKGVDLNKLSDLEKKYVSASLKIMQRKKSATAKERLITDIDDIKEKVKPFFLNSYFDAEVLRSVLGMYDNHLEYLGWAYDVDVSDQTNVSTIRAPEIPFIGQFTRVYEKSNVRIATSKKPVMHRRYYNNQIYMGHPQTFITVVDADQDCYDYIDAGRQYYAEDEKGITHGHVAKRAFSSNKKKYLPQIFLLNDKVKPSKSEDVFSDIKLRHLDKETLLIDQTLMESTVKRVKSKEDRATKKQSQKQTLATKVNTKLKGIETDPTAEININGIKLKKHSIEYLGQTLASPEISVVNLVSRFTNYKGLDELNFDTLSEDFYDALYSKTNNSLRQQTLTGTIGEVPFSIENRVSNRSDGSTSRIVYINDKRVKKDEISEILQRGLCYTTKDAYDSFVAQVSKCSLELHEYLSDGIQLDVHDDYKNKNIKFKIPLVRKMNVNYIQLDGKEYRVSNTRKLMNLESSRHMHEVINTLLDPSVAKIDGPDDIAFIIEKGEELHKADKDKNKKLIERVEKLYNLEVKNLTIGGNSQRGYVIKGKAKNYFLDIGQTDKESFFDRLRVFSYPDMGYVCMIDKTVQQTGPSNLINRIFALHNDALVATEIDTLKLPTTQPVA